ncbi:phosphatidylglycerophosphatase A [Pelagibacteraceae bacterium]|nr:phosphatidylglycerophosphatase A [Pelagibacteraceae bacterium]
MKKITNFFVSLFYSGYFKIYPGTFGSFISILILFPIIKYKFLSFEFLIIIFSLIFLLSLFFISKFSSYTNSHDSGVIVIDEFLGVYIIFIFYDYVFTYNDFLTIILIFSIFRFFDITKIFPANIIDKKMNNSLGVLLDDIVAGVYTIITLVVLNVFS